MPSFPMLIVHDLNASSKWYQEVLGFEHIFTLPGPGGQPTLVHLRCVKYADRLIAEPRDGKGLTEPKGAGVTVNFSMFDRFDGNVDVFAERTREKSAHVVGPIDQSWNVREVTVLDPDGYKLVFSSTLNINLDFDEVIERVNTGKAQE